MAILEGEEALALARRVVETSPADATEVTVCSEADRFVRYADTGVTQNGDRERIEVAIRVRLREGGSGWREARATAGSAEGGEVRAALERSLALAGKSPVDPQAQALGGAVDVRETSLDRATLEHGFAEKGRWVRQAVDGCLPLGLKPSGLARTTGISCALANSSGRAVHGAFNRASLSLTATGADGSGFGDAIGRGVETIDPARVIDRAVSKALGAAAPRELGPGEYAVVLEPAAVASILLFAGYAGFGAREFDEEASFLCGRTGRRVFSELLTVRDDAANTAYPGLPFDGEGTPRSAVTLIDRGLPTGPVTDRSYARKLGVACTGHAQPQPSQDGPRPGNLVIEAGERSLAELVGGVDRGLLVTQFHYTNMIEPRELTLTGMTRNGTYLIEGGEVRGAVRNLRFTETLVNAFCRVQGVGREREVAGALFDGEVVVPALCIEGFRFTSTTDF